MDWRFGQEIRYRMVGNSHGLNDPFPVKTKTTTMIYSIARPKSQALICLMSKTSFFVNQ